MKCEGNKDIIRHVFGVVRAVSPVYLSTERLLVEIAMSGAGVYRGRNIGGY